MKNHNTFKFIVKDVAIAILAAYGTLAQFLAREAFAHWGFLLGLGISLALAAVAVPVLETVAYLFRAANEW